MNTVNVGTQTDKISVPDVENRILYYESDLKTGLTAERKTFECGNSKISGEKLCVFLSQPGEATKANRKSDTIV